MRASMQRVAENACRDWDRIQVMGTGLESDRAHKEKMIQSVNSRYDKKKKKDTFVTHSHLSGSSGI